MRDNMGQSSTGKKILTVVVIAVLIVVLGALWIYNSRTSAARTAALKEQSRAMTASEETKEDSGKAAAETKNSDAKADTKKAASNKNTDKSNTSTAANKTSGEFPTGISVRGESYASEGADKANGYPAMLQKLLKDNNIDLEVHDNTWDMSGTLSQMALAGVDSDLIQSYIDDHTKAAEKAGEEANIYDVRVRNDLQEALTQRDDQNDIPVIVIGYYGGYNDDYDELVEQQQLILDTYGQQEQFIICGFYPENTQDTTGYRQTMEKAWGEHFILLNTVLGDAYGMSEEGRQNFADAIYDKLIELQYISK